MKSLRVGVLVLVEWVDSHSPNDNRWVRLEPDSFGCKPITCHSVGWVAEKSKSAVRLVASISGAHDRGIRVACSSDITIPMSCVVRAHCVAKVKGFPTRVKP